MLSIRCFGALELRRAGRVLPPFPTRRSKLLLAYLIVNRGRAQPREVLLGILWGDEPEALARKHLRTELWRLRAILEPPGVPRGTFLRMADHAVVFSEEHTYWLDVEEFERRVRAPVGDRLDPNGAAALGEALELCRGQFLEGIYDWWALEERGRLKSLLIGALERLMRFHAARAEWSAAITCGERLLSTDPFLEHVHRDLMAFHYALGDRPAAIRQYQACEEFVRREVGVEPMAETQSLLAEIRSGQRRRIEVRDRAARTSVTELRRP